MRACIGQEQIIVGTMVTVGKCVRRAITFAAILGCMAARNIGGPFLRGLVPSGAT